MDDDKNIRRKDVKDYYNPEDMSKWQLKTPIEVLSDILPTLMEARITIEKLAVVIHEHPDAPKSQISWSDQMSLDEMVNVIIDEAQIIERIIKTAGRYRSMYYRGEIKSDIDPLEN